MAKRLNKKVALIGSLVFVLLVVAAIGVMLKLGQDPKKFISDGDAAFKANDLKKAREFYGKAYAHSDSDELKVDILFKIADVYTRQDDWHRVLGTWEKIAKIDPQNKEARLSRLKYYYILADTGAFNWQEVGTQASEMLSDFDESILNKPRKEFDLLSIDDEVSSKTIEDYLYFIKARADFERVRRGAVSDQIKTLEKSLEYFDKLINSNPQNTQAYFYKAEAKILKAKIAASSGQLDEEKRAYDEAVAIMEKAVENAKEDPGAHINLLNMKEQRAANNEELELEKLEEEYKKLADKFKDDPEVYSALAGFYSLNVKTLDENIDKAVEAIETAYEKSDENVQVANRAANLYLKRYNIKGNGEDFTKAVQIAKKALKAPGSKLAGGPKQWENKRNRINLFVFLARAYTDAIKDKEDLLRNETKEEYIANAEEAVHQIEQLLGSGQNLQVIKWRGILDYVKGDEDSAAERLYSVYEKQKASEQIDPLVAHTLAEIYKNSSETGIKVELLGNALKSGIAINRPEVILDYVRELINLRAWNNALSNINAYEEAFGSNEKSIKLKAEALIGARQFEQAEEEISKLEPASETAIEANLKLLTTRIDNLNTNISRKRSETFMKDLKESSEITEDEKYLTQELNGYKEALTEQIIKAAEKENINIANRQIVTAIRTLARNSKLETARELVDKLLEQRPENTLLLAYDLILKESDPLNVSEEKRNELEKQAIKNIEDKEKSSYAMGLYHNRNNDPNKAMAEFRKVIEFDNIEADTELKGVKRNAIEFIFELALTQEDFELAEKITDKAVLADIDKCNGNFFKARLLTQKKQYEDALTAIDECIDDRPVFSQAFLLRGRINLALGNIDSGVSDLQRAQQLNPLNSNIARELAISLHKRNLQIGDTVTAGQEAEMQNALLRAMSLNPQDAQLVSIYSETIKENRPMQALAIRQNLLNADPTVQNAIMLGNMAFNLWQEETEKDRKASFLNIAKDAFKNALNMAPENNMVIARCADFYNKIGQEQRAKELLEDSEDKSLLWKHYFTSGKYNKAKELMQKSYEKNPENLEIIRGLFSIANKQGNVEGIKKYSEELIKLEDNLDNRLLQIQSYLNAGLIDEAEDKLGNTKSQYSENIKLMLLEGWIALRNGDLEGARKSAEKALKESQDYAQAWRLRGEVNMYEGNFNQAIADLKQAKFISNSYNNKVSLAKAYFKADRIGDAIIELKSIAFEPDVPLDARLMLEEALKNEEKIEEVKDFYADILDVVGENIFWLNRAGAFSMSIEDMEQAQSYYERAIKAAEDLGGMSPVSVEGYIECLIRKENLDEALEVCSEYSDGPMAPVAFEKMGKIKANLGDQQEAVGYFKKALLNANENQQLFLNIVTSMQNTLGYEKTWDYCQQMISNNPDSIIANLAAYKLSYDKQQFNQAVEYVSNCLNLTEEDSPKMIDFMTKKAIALQAAYDKTKDPIYMQKAIKQYESLLDKMPNNAAVLNNLSYMLAKKDERLDLALQYAEKAHKLSPNNPSFLDTYAFALFKNNMLNEASKYITSSVQQYERNNLEAPEEVYEHQKMIKDKLETK